MFKKCRLKVEFKLRKFGFYYRKEIWFCVKINFYCYSWVYYTLYTQEGGIVRLYVLVLIYPDTK